LQKARVLEIQDQGWHRPINNPNMGTGNVSPFLMLSLFITVIFLEVSTPWIIVLYYPLFNCIPYAHARNLTLFTPPQGLFFPIFVSSVEVIPLYYVKINPHCQHLSKCFCYIFLQFIRSPQKPFSNLRIPLKKENFTTIFARIPVQPT
jgi:hypothetical protein